jgi:DNA-binding transcriptional ArsR family regulator
MENVDKGIEIYDIETLSNCFTYTGINRDTKEVVKFIIWDDINDFHPLLVHLSQLKGQIGFNNINFDYPVLHYVIKERNSLIKLSANEIAKRIYKKAQSVISQEYSAVKEAEVIIPQLDLFRIWHYDNRARMTSLKRLEINMRFENVMDMPYSHTEKIKTKEQVDEILVYNLNDVKATEMFYEKTKDKIELRRGLLQKYGLQCLNFPDSKIGEQLMLKLYCQYTDQDENDVKKRRTNRSLFKFSECIPEYIKFESPEFNELLDYIKSIEVTELKESFKYSFEYRGFTFDLGTGGLHACIKPGVYQSINNQVIVDCDVASLYPSLAITLGLYPEQLGAQFPEIYENGIVKPRLEAKKNKDMVMADGFKLSANSVYGKSNSEYSFLYDPLYTIKTTLAGQLALCMLSEMLMTRVPDLKMLQVNTDGITVSIPEEHKRLYWNICQEWEVKTALVLEYVAYFQMIIRDVNNYIAVTDKGKVKYKGTFVPVDEMIKNGEYHKNFSQNAVTLAISDYFLNNVPVEESLKNNKNIYDFCKTFNATHGWTCETLDIDEIGIESNLNPEQKINRYYMSAIGKRFRKIKEERKIEIEANKKVIIFNKFVEISFEEYEIDYSYYVDECYKIINKINGTEERLENEKKLERERVKLTKEEENYIKFCVDKIPTQLQYNSYNREWLEIKYGKPSEIRPSKTKL